MLPLWGILFWVILIFVFGIFGLFQLNFINSKVAEYAITSQRILFQSTGKKKEFFEIPLSEINDCIVEIKNLDTNHGTIFLAVKNPKAIPFDTFTVKDNGDIEKRHHPTLENIQNPNEIVKLLRETIQKM